MAVLGQEVEDMVVVMLQVEGGRLRIWGLLCGSCWPAREDMGSGMWQFWVRRLRIWRLLCCSFGAGGRGYGVCDEAFFGDMGSAGASGYGGCCYVAVFWREVEDTGFAMVQFWSGRLGTWGFAMFYF